MADTFEQKITKLLKSIIEIQTILNSPEIKTSKEPQLKKFYTNKSFLLEIPIEKMERILKLIKEKPLMPLLMAYTKRLITTKNQDSITKNNDYYYIFSTSAELSTLKRKLKLQIPDKIIEDLDILGANILNLADDIIQEANNTQTLQFNEKITDEGKKINLTITYGGKNTSTDILQDILKNANFTLLTAETIMQNINTKIKTAIRWTLNTEFFEKILGPTFTTKIQVYITNEKEGYLGCLKQIITKVKNKIKYTYFTPTIQDIRFHLDLNHLINETTEDINSTIMHEITHAFDENLTYRKGQTRLIQDKIREEGLARFQQVTCNPLLLDTVQHSDKAIWTQISITPLNSIKELEEQEKKDKEFAYSIGLYVMLQLLIQLSFKNLKTKITPQNIEPNDIYDHQQQCLQILNTVRLMNTKKFFQYYQKTNNPIFTNKLFKEILK